MCLLHPSVSSHEIHGSWAPWSTSNFLCLCSSTFTFSRPVDRHKYCVVSSLPCFQFQHVISWKLSVVQSGSWVYLSINTWHYDLWIPHWLYPQCTLLLLVLGCFCVNTELFNDPPVKLHLCDTEGPATAPASRGVKGFALLEPWIWRFSLNLQIYLGSQQLLQGHALVLRWQHC